MPEEAAHTQEFDPRELARELIRADLRRSRSRADRLFAVLDSRREQAGRLSRPAAGQDPNPDAPPRNRAQSFGRALRNLLERLRSPERSRSAAGAPPAEQEPPYVRYRRLDPERQRAVENAVRDLIRENGRYQRAYSRNRLQDAGAVAGRAEARELGVLDDPLQEPTAARSDEQQSATARREAAAGTAPFPPGGQDTPHRADVASPPHTPLPSPLATPVVSPPGTPLPPPSAPPTPTSPTDWTPTLPAAARRQQVPPDNAALVVNVHVHLPPTNREARPSRRSTAAPSSPEAPAQRRNSGHSRSGRQRGGSGR